MQRSSVQLGRRYAREDYERILTADGGAARTRAPQPTTAMVSRRPGNGDRCYSAGGASTASTATAAATAPSAARTAPRRAPRLRALESRSQSHGAARRLQRLPALAPGLAAMLTRLFVLGSVAPRPALAAPRKEDKPPRTELSHRCSRAISRATRKEIENEVIKPATKVGVLTWPKGCRLDPALDMYAYQEKQKQKKRGSGTPQTSHSSTWTCGICGKQFKNEHYLDLHMERRHMNTTPRDAVCVADYCEAFDTCNKVDVDRPVGRSAKKPTTPCNQTQLLELREQCHETLAGCLSLTEAEPRLLHAKLSRHFCQSLDCDIRSEKLKEQQNEPMPAVVIMILILLAFFVCFFIMVCCVDYSDEIVQWLVETGFSSRSSAKQMVKSREAARKAAGLDRTKCI
eukprot:TRINITY_DN3875_c0_g3_i1.p2 TRINITY_DN3875_c0_g3~~TRINITY_DN3875_c0_g3_i1.p2  ORF type:complete len:401 (-),score=83.88 TRINITY_DN3875_c0_g3_i1:33-1235(-)